MDRTMLTPMLTPLTSPAHEALSAGAATPPAARAGMDRAAIEKTAEEFEAFYLAQALQPMFADVSPADPFNGGSGEDMWRSLQVQEYGKALARNGGVGLANSVVREMLRMQDMGENPAP